MGRALLRWPGPVRKAMEPALKRWLTEQISEASSMYSANDRACLLTLLNLMLESDLGKWAQPKTQERVRALLLEDRAQLGSFINEPTSGPLALGRARSEAERAAVLSEIEALVLAGDREEAVQRAVAAGQWPHALVLAATLPRAVWHNVVAQWLAQVARPGEPLHLFVQMANTPEKTVPGPSAVH